MCSLDSQSKRIYALHEQVTLITKKTSLKCGMRSRMFVTENRGWHIFSSPSKIQPPKRETLSMSLQACRKRQVTAWSVVAVLFIQMLVPFGQALSLDTNSDLEYQIICTADGIKRLAISEDGQPIQPTGVETCVFCGTHMPTVMAVPQSFAFLTYDALAKCATRPLLSQQTQVNIWRAARPSSRAPPLFV